jgi:hypothetical protein
VDSRIRFAVIGKQVTDPAQGCLTGFAHFVADDDRPALPNRPWQPNEHSRFRGCAVVVQPLEPFPEI